MDGSHHLIGMLVAGLDDELMLLAGALEKGHMPRLAELGLSNNKITPRTFSAVVQALGATARPDFCILGASNNQVGNIGCHRLARTCQSNLQYGWQRHSPRWRKA